MLLDKIRDTIQDCNLNFLIGSGLSRPFLPTLGRIEVLLTELAERDNIDHDAKKLIRASLYKKYFDAVIKDNVKVLNSDPATNDVQENYKTFLKAINSVLLKRKVTLLSKEANIFTTNVDIFLDKALEDLNLEYNDGFNGRFNPKFSLSNFKKSHFKKSLHYDNTAELPIFNLLKLHGSLSWAIQDKDVIFSCNLNHIKEVESKTVSYDHILDVPDDATIDSLITASAGKTVDASTEAFLDAYEKLLIVVNPTKEKFKHTLMNQTYYELLRLYSNELEKENTVLFVMGFSFADEHICEITLRAANSNPTLIINVIAHSTQAKKEIEERFGKSNIKNNNIEVFAPEQETDPESKQTKDKFKYDLATINKEVFGQLLEKVNCEDVEEAPEEETGETIEE
ncbi:MAG: hypothetical protein BWY14_01149 [Parcubacteria group bacterium ADurb.Bin192]|nr:MAG: hypothetical protein BWY14_01149 [Parcubacteria group bacterium ADurb.Bin192]